VLNVYIRLLRYDTKYFLQIEGFKLHVTHNVRPFTGKVRYTPEVASRPDRLEKDLENAKKLASILEEQAAKLRSTKAADLVKKTNGEDASEQMGEDSNMNSLEEEEEEPKESGTEAVERRIEKVMADMRDQGLVDVNDEKAYEEKRVNISLCLFKLISLNFVLFSGCYST